MTTQDYDSVDNFLQAIEEHAPVLAYLEGDEALAAHWAHMSFVDSEGILHHLHYESDAELSETDSYQPLRDQRDRALEVVYDAIVQHGGLVDFMEGSLDDGPSGETIQQPAVEDPVHMLNRMIEYTQPDTLEYALQDSGALVHLQKASYHLFATVPIDCFAQLPEMDKVPYETLANLL
jgi:hypothetical protein